MILKDTTITKGFLFAGLMNLTVLVFSRFFTNETINNFDPVVMSNFGLLMIAVWGLAYISVAKRFYFTKWLVVVFAIEKFIYGFIWIKWLMENDLKAVYQEDVMAGLYYSSYGINDILFCLFFLLIFIHINKNSVTLKA